jgi:LysM repeat protein
LGCLGNSARTRRRLPIVAAPALAGVAAAFALASAPSASALATQAPAGQSAPVGQLAASPATRHLEATAAWLASATRSAKHAAARPDRYVVKSGDTLSSIAEHFYKNPDFWPVLYWANHGQIRYADVIKEGQVLAIPAKPAKVPGVPSVLGPVPVAVPASAAAPAYAPVAAPQEAAPPQVASTYAGAGGSFQACVIAAESGGNSQVVNGTGHYGLYQFSSSTWAEYGGNSADFGDASVAEQNQVFNSAIAAGGASNWAPYDGC